MEWIKSCNVKEIYNVFDAFEELEAIDWTKRNNNIKKGDVLFIYVGKPYMKIMYKCLVMEDHISASEAIDDSKFIKSKGKANIDESTIYVRLKKISYVDDERLSFEELKRKNLVLGNMQGARKSEYNPKLFDYINSIFDEK